MFKRNCKINLENQESSVCKYSYTKEQNKFSDCTSNMKKIKKEKMIIFSVLMLFFAICAYYKDFWEFIIILLIVYISTFYEFIKEQRS